MFDIEYHQVYTHNSDGIVAGTIAWNRFLGDRQFGWLARRPTCDLLIKLDAFTEGYALPNRTRSALDLLITQLEVMTARYRIGDGAGGTYVGAAHNCSQDSNQALYTALKEVQSIVKANADLQRATAARLGAGSTISANCQTGQSHPMGTHALRCRSGRLAKSRWAKSRWAKIRAGRPIQRNRALV